MRKWKVISRENTTHDVFVVKLERPVEPGPFEFQAGQYLSIVIPGAGPGGRNLRRAYSIASPPEQNEIDLCVKLVEGGPGTNYLNKLRAGDYIEGQAPFGDFCLEHDQSLPTLFIGTGTGLAPLRSMILSNEWKGRGPVAFLLGVREEKDIIYPEMFPEMPESKGALPAPLSNQEHVRICLSRPKGPWNGFQGRVTDYLRRMDWNFKDSHIYLCGSGAMIQEVKDFAMATHGLTKEQIHLEKYF